jgi:glycosyltransferase involved in cell wall biosynthesis
MAYLRSYLRRFARRIDAVIAPSGSIAEWLAEFGVTDDAIVLPNGVDTAPFRSPAQPRSRRSLGLPEDAVVFCYLGRVGEEKNIPLLVDAYCAAAKDTRAALLIIGDGPARAHAEIRVAEAGLTERVQFAGLVPYADVPGYLAACDAFATASVTEVHPLVVVEAMAAGLPVVGVRSPGIADTIEDGLSGLLASEDASGLAAHMRRLATDEPLRKRLSQGARRASQRYDISVTGARLLAEYERVVVEHRPRERTSRVSTASAPGASGPDA